MEGISLGLSEGPSRQVPQSPEPPTEVILTKKRSREEKEARREAKKLKKAKKDQGAYSTEPPKQSNGDVFTADISHSNGSNVDQQRTESKVERAKRKAEKAERKFLKEQQKADALSNESKKAATTQADGRDGAIKKSSKKSTVSSKQSVPHVEIPTQTRVKKRDRSQTTPLVSLSQAGPSNPSTPKKPIITTKAVRAPSTARSRASSSSQTPSKRRKGENEVDDVTLRARLTDQNAMEDWLANNWVSDKELGRLERLGILRYKKGKLTEDEKIAIRKVLESYQKVHRLSHAQLVDTIMASSTTFPGGREGWQAFWLELAGAVPGRPGRYVLKMVQRMYNPNGHKGHFTPEEDAMLIRAYELHPNNWGKIAEIVERTYHDCRDRYTKELRHYDTRVTGEWSLEEKQHLLNCIKKMNRSLGRDEMESEGIPWELVVKEMGGTRTVVQCRKKWSDEIYPTKVWGWEKGHKRENDYALIKRLETLNYPSEKHIKWKEVQDDSLNHMTIHQVRQMYYRLKDKIPEANDIEFPEVVRRLTGAVESLKFLRNPAASSKNEITSDDEADAENEDELDEGGEDTKEEGN
ncbi:uncharacterized protein I303_105551 [Kwoniella dejecticola CBS 10117]|uniref:Myb-like domain-containing protein n=1 Tax=Kwoniella dejecticola CBS 10117 TaxID=1296121 RepID=A0A1A6A286_9TREE|nr:uncharacterized protein I303_05006 [Kwoniella dejecticola CBS 10117]OBR84149.1 hypothetical protein I303_05006 [Kwoniella dejecticola CBS 10117]